MASKIEKLFGLNCGIYCIKNKINNKLYVGSSLNLKSRKNLHYSSLKDNKHHSKKLQRAYNKYGKENFEYFILEYCLVEDLHVLEKEWLNYFNSYHNGYNSTDQVGAPWRGKKLPEKIKKLQKCTPVKIINPEGQVVEDYSISNFCITNRLHIGAISDVLKGKYFQYKGWRKYTKELEGVPFDPVEFYKKRGNKLAKTKCELVDPNGHLVKIKNLSLFAKENKLDRAAIHRVVNKKNNHCWGWRLASNKTIGVKCIPKLLRKKNV
jgi:group I intron endonuclease